MPLERCAPRPHGQIRQALLVGLWPESMPGVANLAKQNVGLWRSFTAYGCDQFTQQRRIICFGIQVEVAHAHLMNSRCKLGVRVESTCK
jgi:hypothetical protein